jgi:hypothetical protein
MKSAMLFVSLVLAMSTPTQGGDVPEARQIIESASSPPNVSRCDLEATQRVAFRVDNIPKGAVAVGLRLHFYDSHKA